MTTIISNVTIVVGGSTPSLGTSSPINPPQATDWSTFGVAQRVMLIILPPLVGSGIYCVIKICRRARGRAVALGDRNDVDEGFEMDSSSFLDETSVDMGLDIEAALGHDPRPPRRTYHPRSRQHRPRSRRATRTPPEMTEAVAVSQCGTRPTNVQLALGRQEESHNGTEEGTHAEAVSNVGGD